MLASLPDLTHEELEKILRIENDELRNLRVTLGYFDLSNRQGGLLGTTDANGCTLLFGRFAQTRASSRKTSVLPVITATEQCVTI